MVEVSHKMMMDETTYRHPLVIEILPVIGIGLIEMFLNLLLLHNGSANWFGEVSQPTKQGRWHVQPYTSIVVPFHLASFRHQLSMVCHVGPRRPAVQCLHRIHVCLSTCPSLDLSTYLISRHAVMNQQCNPRIQISDVPLQYKVLFTLGRDLALEIAKTFLG